MTPEEKAAAAQAKITEGGKLEKCGDDTGAYNLYKQAADLDYDKGRLNCAILLVQDRVIYKNNRGTDISYEVARQFAAVTLEKSQDKKYRGVACNLLGILYNTGGKGIRRNVSLAIKYFEQGAALGDENAIKNLKDMRKARKRSRR
jgi:TPR repeat protein